jgi:hypothetical protein
MASGDKGSCFANAAAMVCSEIGASGRKIIDAQKNT